MIEKDYEEEWYEENNITSKIKSYLVKEDYEIKKFNKDKRMKGHDIIAIKNNEKYIIEVKGYPWDRYSIGEKKGQVKTKTIIKKQAKIWFGKGLYQLILAKSKDPMKHIVLGLPSCNLYKELINKVRFFREIIEMKCILVDQKGNIELIKKNEDC